MNNTNNSKDNYLKMFNSLNVFQKREKKSASDIDHKKTSIREDDNNMNDNINILHNDMMKTINECKTLIANLNDVIKAIEAIDIEETSNDIKNNNINTNNNNSKAKNIYKDKETINKNNYMNENINKIKQSATEYSNQNAYTEKYLSNKNAFAEALHELLDNYYETHDIDDIDDINDKNYDNLIDENEDEYIKYYSQPVEYNNPCNKDCYTCDSFINCPYIKKENNKSDCKADDKADHIYDNSCKSKCNNKCDHECECSCGNNLKSNNDIANDNVTDRVNEIETKDITLYVYDEIYDGVRNIEYYCDTCDGQTINIEGNISRPIKQHTTLNDIKQIYTEVVHGLLFDKPNIKYKFRIFYNNTDVSACVIDDSLCTSK